MFPFSMLVNPVYSSLSIVVVFSLDLEST
jgi:hypothetical protein